ncbi:uncharacterized protein F4812DRAFT_296870 [Daldinia caldariorum]|uniref:uncharacterized protein n=1 Tax=Daldinia caldariorum TaxID=326644 RepID=UPI0020082612|nr:uncharacterized protein F4812DRAFT_296870 [Daldinia caldariorum]KAI1469634.1 hypothetical protein F4812DRAFT_296870 [Daldinia caldariorum]
MADTPSTVSVTPNQHDLPPASVNSDQPTQVKPKPRPTTPKGPPLHQIYALPAPIRTFPLPAFYPSNPLSLFHVVYAWVSQLVSPPPAEPAVIHQGTWSPETRSVHIKDPKSIRALWEQGFFGKGNYSRSEPNWLKREQARRGEHDGHVAEAVTAQRREERKMMKWDRARKEQEAIERTRQLEAWKAPVGPAELLALPNSWHDLKPIYPNGSANGTLVRTPILNSTRNVSEATNAVSNGIPISVDTAVSKTSTEITTTEKETIAVASGINGHSSRPQTPTNPPKRRKSVRFSPKVESTTFQLSDPPSPHHGALTNGTAINGSVSNGISPLVRPTDLGLSQPVFENETIAKPNSQVEPEPEPELVDKEHLQLCPEEAFYLVFVLGVLSVFDPATGKPMTVADLFALCRQVSYMPPKKIDLQPDDPFLIHYAVYHHFRSLGWVTRPGIKFGVDWMLYNRGPVFSHAEFAVIVLPAYTDPWWKAQGRQPPRKSWHWLHTMNRVQATALKTLVLAYVDVPPPFEEGLGAAEIFKRYRVREFIVKRWLSNRNRD